MPFLPLSRPEAQTEIGRALPDHVHLLAGLTRIDPARPAAGETFKVYNSLVTFDGSGDAIGIYDKIHLVPYGEYLPFQATLESIGLVALTRQRGGFTGGPGPRPLLAVPGLPPALGLICYEAVFPAAVVQGGERPHVLINITNDGWFGDTTGPRQHLQQSRVRAVEEGLPMMRVANNGITAAYDPYGRQLARLEFDVRGVIDVGLPQRIEPPVYARLGDLMLLLTWLIAGATLAACRRCQRIHATDWDIE